MNSLFAAAFASIASTLAAAQPSAQPAPPPASPYIFPAATPESVGLSSKDLGDLDAAVQSYIDSGEAVGAELMVIKNRKTVWHTAHGFADSDAKKELTPGSIYCVRSMTKPVVGTAIQMLIDGGHLSLSDPAAKFLPDFDSDTHRAITIQHLLTHTSGLPLSSLVSADHKSLTSVQDVAALAAKATLVGAPGEKYRYSDDGTDTLTAIVEKVSGLRIEDFIQQRILDPLGMRDTMPVAAKADPRVARMIPLYVGSTGAWTRHWAPGDDPLFPYFLGSQALYSTCEDYARFLCLWADAGQPRNAPIGKPLLSKGAVTRALTPAREMGYPSGFTGLRTDYGQLWMLLVDPATDPPRRIAFGHGGSDGTLAWMWPEEDLIVLYFTQSRGGLSVVSIEKDLDRYLFGGTAAPAQSFEPFVGIYWDAEESTYRAIVERDGKLNIEIPGQFFGAIIPGPQPNHWKLELSPNVELIFQRPADGPAESLEINTGENTALLQRLSPTADLPTADATIARVLTAHGTAKLATVGVIKRTGSTDMPTLKRHLSMVHLIDGARMRVEISSQGSPGQTIINDGTTVWSQTGNAKPEKLSDALQEQSRLEHPISAFGDWRKDYREVTVVGRTKLEETPAVIVRCVPKLGHPTAMYVSEETGLVIGQDKVAVIPGLGAIGISVLYGDYRDIGGTGIMLPFKNRVEYSSPFLGHASTTIDTAEVGVPAEPGTFAPQT